jgi:hypothetical protein
MGLRRRPGLDQRRPILRPHWCLNSVDHNLLGTSRTSIPLVSLFYSFATLREFTYSLSNFINDRLSILAIPAE